MRAAFSPRVFLRRHATVTMRTVHRRNVAFLILPAAVAVGLASLAGRIAALRPVSSLVATGFGTAPDEVRDEVGPFLESRDTVEFVLARSMTLGELLDLYRIDFRHVPPQVAAQTYPPVRSLASVIDSGTHLRLSLTRPDTATP
jgi:hypothetical protein